MFLCDLITLFIFQFHKGAIRTEDEDALRLGIVDFNSIKVRLEHTESTYHRYTLLHFNSIKVRLEQKRVPLLLLPWISIP